MYMSIFIKIPKGTKLFHTNNYEEKYNCINIITETPNLGVSTKWQLGIMSNNKSI